MASNVSFNGRRQQLRWALAIRRATKGAQTAAVHGREEEGGTAPLHLARWSFWFARSRLAELVRADRGCAKEKTQQQRRANLSKGRRRRRRFLPRKKKEIDSSFQQRKNEENRRHDWWRRQHKVRVEGAISHAMRISKRRLRKHKWRGQECGEENLSQK